MKKFGRILSIITVIALFSMPFQAKSQFADVWLVEISGGALDVTTDISPQRFYEKISGGFGIRGMDWFIIGASLSLNQRYTGDTLLPNPEQFFGAGILIRLDGGSDWKILPVPNMSIGLEVGLAGGFYSSFSLGFGGRWKGLIKFDLYDGNIQPRLGAGVSCILGGY